MKLIIGSTTYTQIRNVRFSPECDITCASLPINEFTADIQSATDPVLSQDGYAELRDDRNALFARYYVRSLLKVAEGLYRIRAASPLFRLESKKVPAVMYNEATVGMELSRLLELGMGANSFWVIGTEIPGRKFSGYCPEQTIRDRVLHICLATGVFIRSFGADRVQVRDWDDTVSIIPPEETYFRPEPAYRDFIQAVKAKAYTFTEGSPQQGDTAVEADGHTYIVTAQETSLSLLPGVTGTTDNAVDVSSCMLINADNVDDVLSRLSKYYFYPMQVQTAIINNGSHWPGDKLTIPLSEDRLVTGYMQKANFAFGVQAKSTLTLVGCTTAASAELTVKYVWNGINLGKKVYYFPAGYSYNIATRAIDKTMNHHRYIFYPQQGSVSGTMTAQGATVTVNCDVALDLYKKVLTINIVDEVSVVEKTVDGETTLVGVIT